MPEEPANPSALPGRSRPALSELSKETTEADLWNLDDDVTAPPPPQPAHPPQPRVMPRSEAEPAAPEPPPASLSPADTAPPPQGPQPPRPRGRTPAQQRPDHDQPLGRPSSRGSRNDEIGELEEPAQAAPQAAPAAPDRPVPPPENQPRPAAEEAPPRPASTPAPAREPGRPLFPRIERREAVGLAAFAVVLCLVAIWILAIFFGRLEFRSEFVEMPDFPAPGEHASLAAAQTFWREPIREGAGRDFARREAKMIPVLELTLEPARSPGGALLVIFRNAEGEPLGDSIRRSFRNGTFDASGTAAMSFPATDGFLEESAYQAYRTGRGRPWVAEVLEGPSVDAPAGTFKPLATIPVSPLRR